MKVVVVSKFERRDDPSGIYVDTTSHGIGWESSLSPFRLGPCPLYGGHVARNMENGWQFSKVYREHVDPKTLEPTLLYWRWAGMGWSDYKAHRYPMGKGRRPLYSQWCGGRLDYIQARKHIYVPLYAKAVVKTIGWRRLKEFMAQPKGMLYLCDYDAYRHERARMTLTDVLNCSDVKMGHAFVLMMLLTNDRALEQCAL